MAPGVRFERLVQGCSCHAFSCPQQQLSDDAYSAREGQVAAECDDAFGAVTHFESTHGLVRAVRVAHPFMHL